MDYFEAIYDQQWPDDWIAGEFDNNYKDFIFTTVLKKLAWMLPSNRRKLVDVGAHVGKMVSMADQAGWIASGIEFNAKTANFAASKTGRPIHRMDARSLAATGERFDAVVLTDVLEHIPRPLDVLHQFRELLESGGAIAVKVPFGINQRRKQLIRAVFDLYADVGIANTMVHVNHFSPKSLRIALEKAGFTNVVIQVGAPELPITTGLRSRFEALQRMAFYYAASYIPGGANSPLCLNLQAYARVP